MPEAAARRPAYRHILALVQLDGHDDALIAQASLLARLCQARLDLLHLVDLPPAGDGYPAPGRAEAARAYEAAARRRMAFLAGRHGIEADRCHARYGPAAHGFRDYVVEQAPELVVVAHDQAELVAGPWDVLALRSRTPGRGQGLLARLGRALAGHLMPAGA